MIAELISESYDIDGRKVFRPDFRRHSGFKPTFPAGRFLSKELNHWCSDIPEMRRFLSRCNYVSDQEQFAKKDYWQPPEQFENSRRGDCDDFALWAWRQLLHMGYVARFVVGRAGRYGGGHAWVTFENQGKAYLCEPLAAPFGATLPRLSALRYKPRFSMGWDGKTISYYEHDQKNLLTPPRGWLLLTIEWTLYWTWFWVKTYSKLFLALVYKIPGIRPTANTSRR